MIRFITLTLVISLTTLALTQSHQPFYWLEGIWEMKKPNGSSRLEVWTYNENDSMTGKGLKVMKGDTTILESIELIFEDDHYWYIPTVPDQNNALPVPFKLVNTKGFIYTFENPEHDFPQRIIYHLKPFLDQDDYMPSMGDTLFVRVEALDGDGMDFQFYRK